MVNQMNAKAGAILIAEPFLNDPNFDRAVVFLCSHNAEGSLGFVLNQPQAFFLSDLLENCTLDLPVYLGGPVEQGTLHFLHCFADLATEAHEVLPGVFWGGSIETIIEKLHLGLLDPNGIRFFIGYSGWGEGQLDNELKQNAWFVSTGSNEMIFAQEPLNLWRKVLRDMGGSYKVISHYPTDPSLN
jgi:putative transcriptional regulator